MYRAIAATLAFGIAMTPAPAFAAQEAAGNDEAEMNRVICKRESVVGSRVQKRRTCLTKREWIDLQVKTRDGVSDFVKRATQGAPPPQ